MKTVMLLALITVVFSSYLSYPWLEGYDPIQSIANRIPAPPGYVRIFVKQGSFQDWLRNLPLKKGNPPVHLFNGMLKENQEAHFAVIDMDVGDRDLQQCADAIIRLRAEYLYSIGSFDSIQFKLTNGDIAEFKRWVDGYRPVVTGNEVKWVRSADKGLSYARFREYLKFVFTYAGSYSLSRGLKRVRRIEGMRIGDLFIDPGFPGHAVLVVDMAAERRTGRRIFLLAQSYMPAQEMHILKNPMNPKLSPWYELNFGEKLYTPEWTFDKTDLMRFKGGEQMKASGKTGFVYHESYLQHDTGGYHPESPARLKAIVERLERDGVLPKLILIEPTPADLDWIATVHTRQYIEEVKRSCLANMRFLHSPDTIICPRSYDVARLAVGGVLAAIDAVMEGRVKNVFCAIRPPGHHALKSRAMGFCLFNNVAIGARYIQRKYGLSKVLIVDWDVHHGNGTQAIFYDDPTVLYFSTHQYPFYPGTGSREERGIGKGEGYTLNVPLPAGSGDEEYVRVFEEILRPKAIQFDPDFILISAGFDPYEDDPIGGMRVTPEGFAELTKIVKEIAEECCEGRLVSVLEGGYNLEGLAESVEAHILALMR